MASKFRLSYQRKLFILTASLTLLLTLCFLIFQYNRESHYKSEALNSKLQRLNIRVADKLADGLPPEEIFYLLRTQEPSLRLTLIDSLGEVFYDSESGRIKSTMPNHLNRAEIAEALSQGEGYTILRHSQSVKHDYFYSALYDKGVVIRSALPYDFSLIEALSVDYRLLSYIAIIGLASFALSYLITRRLSQNIRHLRAFTSKLDSGADIEDEPRFANDELGEIANHIVELYKQLQRAVKDAEREHRIALEQEMDKIRLKRQLTNNINHELKTPVSAIMGYLESIILNPDIDPETRNRFIERCYEQTKRLEQLISDLSIITRIDDAPTLIQCEECDLREVIDEAVEECVAPDFEVELSLPKAIPIYGNLSLLRSIFQNMLSNAVSYSSGSKIEIRLLDESAEGYRFSVADNGVGVEQKHLSLIFERFYRVDKGRSRKMGGTGLGLSIVKNAIAFHGGSVQAQNRAEGGLELIFTLLKSRV